MGLSFLTPLFLAGFLAVAVPVTVHLIRRHRGRNMAFPSLMFLRRLPIQSVRKRRIRDWPLLLLRVGALALIVLAFARPVLQLEGTDEAAEGDGLREVVLVMDRSWSMARGDRWERAVEAAESVLDELVTPDRVSLVTFDQLGTVVVNPTLDPGRVRSALESAQPGWSGTQIGAGLQAAGGIVEASDRSRREIVLISDFQRRGWEDGPRDPLPTGTRLVPVDVGDDGRGSTVVSEVTLSYSFLEGRQRVQPVARIVRQGEAALTGARVAFEMDGQEVAVRTVELPAEGATLVEFDPVTLPEEGILGAVRLALDGSGSAEPFRFFLSPREVVSILLVQAGGAASGSPPYLRNALSVAGGSPVRVEVRSNAQLSAADIEAAELVVFNDLPLPSGNVGELLRSHVRTGGGLFVIAGPGSAPANWDAQWIAALPGRVGAPVDRDPARGARLSGIDRDHPVFQGFSGSQAAGLGSPRFYRYRAVEELPDSASDAELSVEALASAPRVVARFDDGAPALIDAPYGSGRILVWTSGMDTAWSDFPLHPSFLPVVQEVAKHAAGGRESVPYFAVGQPLDSRYLLGEEPRPAGTNPTATPQQGTEPAGVGTGIDDAFLVGPDGTGMELSTETGQLIRLDRPGFYEIRVGDEAGEIVRRIAVNPDAREADPARMDPAELVLAVTAPAGETEGALARGDGLLLDGPDGATLLQEGERRQGAWRFLLLGAILLLVTEAIVAGRRQPLATQAKAT